MGSEICIGDRHKGLRRTRAAALSIAPTKIGATQAVALVFPEFKDKFDGHVLRVLTPVGSVTDLISEIEKPVTVESVSAVVKTTAEGPLKGILAYTEDPIASEDIETDPHSSIFGSGLIKIADNQMKVISWYGNEWGYSDRLVNFAKLVGSKL